MFLDLLRERKLLMMDGFKGMTGWPGNPLKMYNPYLTI